MIEENNVELSQNIKYTYDDSGNLLNVKKYNEQGTLIDEKNYKYENKNWEDLLTDFNGVKITYDAVGNPLKIGEDSLTWINGTELKTYINNKLNANYTYDDNGCRTKKVVNGVETQYFTLNKKIIYSIQGNDILYFKRDASGNLLGFNYNNLEYYYLKNLQNDIIGILDNNLELVVTYKYDSFGNLVSMNDTSSNNIGTINPFRYRGYYLDAETGLYYLNTRYYNPQWGRFINADKILNTKVFNGHNTFIYGNNNFIFVKDSEGSFGILAFTVVSFFVGAFIGGTAKAASNWINKEPYKKGVVKAAVSTGLSSALAANGIVGKKNTVISSVVGNTADYLANREGNYVKKVAEGVVTDLAWGELNIGPKIGSTWIKPSTLKSALLGNYQKKLIANSIIGSMESMITDQISIELSKKSNNNSDEGNYCVPDDFVPLHNNLGSPYNYCLPEENLYYCNSTN